jgi:galactose-1-phosphate uridylyltransferase
MPASGRPHPTTCKPTNREVVKGAAVTVEFRRQLVESRILNPFRDFALETVPVEVRWDPLLEHSVRLIQRSLAPTALPDLTKVIDRTSNCFFCAPNLESSTPRILPEISDEARFTSGQAVLFPNIAAYAKYSAVSVFSTAHFVTLAELTPELIVDVLRVNRRYAEAVFAHDRDARYASISANYLPSAGGSMIHPHVQVSLDPVPTTMSRWVARASGEHRQRHGRSYWEDLVSSERERNERYIGRIGSSEWLAAYAPLGFDEVQAVVPGRSTLLELSDSDLWNLAEGLSHVLHYYADTNHNSYNLAIYSAPLDEPVEYFPLHLRIITRSNYEAYYRSDATYWERLHWEALISTTPEETALALRRYFDHLSRASN